MKIYELAVRPQVDVPGDGSFAHMHRVMYRSGDLIGFNATRAVWRFGFLPGSPAALAYDMSIEPFEDDDRAHFLWVLANRKTGDVEAEHRGMAKYLPDSFRLVLDQKMNIGGNYAS